MASGNKKSGNEQPTSQKSGLLESVLIAAVGALPFIAWGSYVNWEYGPMIVAKVAVAQGSISFVSTFFSAELLRALFGKFARPMAAFWGATLLGWLCINTAVLAMHVIAGTPEKLMTMLPGLVVSVFFCAAYSWRLKQAISKRN